MLKCIKSVSSLWPGLSIFKTVCLFFIMVFMFFRLELLLQIANKIQNGALNCEEKLTLAKNTLQAVSALCHGLTSFHPVALTVEANSWGIQLCYLLFLDFSPWLWVRAMEVSHPYSFSVTGCCTPGIRTASAVWVRCHLVHSRVWESHQAAAGGSPDPTGWKVLPVRRAGL